jgi:hypothetical protein
MKCVVCGKDSLVEHGWHLKYNLDFCGNSCVARYIERRQREIIKLEKNLLKRICKVEKTVIKRGQEQKFKIV